MEDEKLVNTANRLFSGYIKEGLATVASLAFGEQPKWFDNKEPQTFNQTSEQLQQQLDARMAADKVDVFTKSPKDPFSGEETTATTSKVSNKSTIGGASLAGDLQDTIAEVSNKHNIDPELMSLIVQRESANGKYTLSPKGARGYAQIMPKTWNEEVAPALGFTPEDIDDPVKNMEGGAWYMGKMMQVAKRKFPKADEREIVDIAAAYYNWGQGNVGEAMQKYGDNWLKHAPKETKNYVQFLRDTYKREDEMLDGGPVGQDLNAWALLAALEDYIDYDRLPEDLKKKVKDPSTKAMREYYHQ